MLDLDLQLFADESADAGAVEESAESGAHKDDEKQVSVGEMKRRLGNQAKKHEEEIEELKLSIEKQINEAVKKEREIAKLNGKELEEFKQKEAEKRYQAQIEERDKELEALRKENLMRTIRDEAYNKVAELKLPNIAETIQLLEADSLDQMADKAELLANYTTHIKNIYAKSNPPLGSGGMGSKPQQTPAEIFRNANIINKRRDN